MLEDINPDPVRLIKYPNEIRKNNDPASAWLKLRSISILGVKGASMMRETKLRKKIEVKMRRGPN
jgi:hypothetical protein